MLATEDTEEEGGGRLITHSTSPIGNCSAALLAGDRQVVASKKERNRIQFMIFLTLVLHVFLLPVIQKSSNCSIRTLYLSLRKLLQFVSLANPISIQNNAGALGQETGARPVREV